MVRLCGNGSQPASALWKVGELIVQDSGQPLHQQPLRLRSIRLKLAVLVSGPMVHAWRFVTACEELPVHLKWMSPCKPLSNQPKYFAGLTLDTLDKPNCSTLALHSIDPTGATGAKLSVDAGPHHDEWELTLQGGTEGKPPNLQNRITSMPLANSAKRTKGVSDSTKSRSGSRRSTRSLRTYR